VARGQDESRLEMWRKPKATLYEVPVKLADFQDSCCTSQIPQGGAVLGRFYGMET